MAASVILIWRDGDFMRTTGIIAEYNPFHNGHAYQIDTIRRQTGADNIVIVMSGNFVQRGAPAFTDKYLRTSMALYGGADFVFELPVIYSTASAGLFALGGISMLDSLGFVDSICFGSECGSIDLLNMAADITLSDDYKFNSLVNSFVKSGLSYPKALYMAAEKHFPEYTGQICSMPGNPNDILAVEYLKALKLLKSNIKPFTLKRCDSGYNSTDYKNSTDNFASASAIRHIFSIEKEPLKAAASFIPESTLDIISQNINRTGVNEDMFSDILYYKLRSILDKSNIAKTTHMLAEFLDISAMLANRIANKIDCYDSFTGFIKTLKTKDYTYSRISRSLLHIILDIQTDNFNMPLPLSLKNRLDSCQITPYARLLGMNKSKSSILRNISRTTLVTKTADAARKLEAPAMQMFKKDIFAADIYRQACRRKCKNTCPDEYRPGVLIK